MIPNNKTTVIVASSDSKIRESARAALEQEGLDAILCGDGEEVLDSVKSQGQQLAGVRLMVMDAFLPKIDGFEAVKQMEDFAFTREIPVLMLINRAGDPFKHKIHIRMDADDYMEKPFDTEELRQRIHSMVKYYRAHNAPHPITNLEGHPRFEKEVIARLNRGESFGTVWIDVNHFRPFNDHCGREQGNEVLRMVARLIQTTLQSSKLRPEDTPVAHIAGDDFIAMMPKDKTQDFIRKLKEQFQAGILQFYSEEEKKQGFFYEKGRDQTHQIYPLMSLSAVILDVAMEQFTHYGQLVSRANDLLRQAKVGAQNIR